MPKERVYSRQFIPETNESPAPRLAVQVTWSKEQGHVQIATLDGSAPEFPGGQMTNHTFAQIARYADRLAARPEDLRGHVSDGSEPMEEQSREAAPVLAEPSGSDLGRPKILWGLPFSGDDINTDIIGEMVPGVHKGWFVTLERNQINDLIRLLRRARDGAFGADA